MRLTLRVAMIVAGLIALLPLHYLWKLLGRYSPWPRTFLRWVGYSAGLRVRVVGRPLKRHVLFVSNHLSWLDIMLIAGTSGAAFISKDDVARWPVIGWLASLNNTVFVARENRKAVRGQADQLRAALATGQPVALFPEGTTEGGHEVLPFRASLLSSVVPPLPGLRVQPVAIDYGSAAHDIAWVGAEKAAANARRILSRPGSIAVTIYFLAALDPASFTGRKEIAEHARRQIISALEESETRRTSAQLAP